ncbi:MAG: AraC family transcriptional regulator [Verrucomicrobia bacterium]|nr:AraC family transcriptional regulator [Verrucomicrobiota bacterium]MBU4291440.1 AraC family transcriptional regulator [Verrucomicrobiota bacterium]MBU4430448.1 AraC family transcriptional regulator [Verrucomicrobiota bacterium]MCG2679564.1 AraC family transcriptional regulator [Kiritimatiellia bacterium]
MAKTIRYFFEHPPIHTPALCVRGIGIREPMRPGIVDRPAGTGDILIMFFYDETIIRTARGTRRHPPDSLMIWPRAAGHYYGNPDKAWTHSWTHCDGTAIRHLLARERLPVNVAIPNINAVGVEHYLMDLHLELTGGNPPDAVIIRNIFHNWFREIRRRMQPRENQPATPPQLLNVRWYMEMHFAERLTLILLARQACLSAPHFCAEFKRYFGVAPIEWLIRLRMRQAAYLLRDHNLRIVDVAEKTGYPDRYYFSRLFKKRFGISPLAYRRTAGSS